ncbi:MAG: hypothetical protein GWO41_10065 [candidate division Zixibacteria bacterium]|nr:hypothetical protein [candidate division Zixibacteria bacterium]NIR67633.1 hypothetical protein [candidate division Zixibacteria bacterium]NIS16693.1 hypothetical protein [candidate division Zixibacteria bacterium]NIS48891.1 hypothetical protein [candidate division Zixibacteria bacterium]NIT53063.1 hypothetical protein [candidate division Zixibacteria bacterium]
MRKLLTLTVSLIFVLSLTVVSHAQMTGDEIIQKYLENTGGMENYQNLNTLKMEGKSFMGQVSGDIVLAQKAPNMQYMKWSSPQFEVLVASNGEQIWSKYPTVPGYIFVEEEDLPKQLEGMRISPYIDYKERGAKAELVGEEKVKGQDAYNVRYIQAAGDTTTLYFAKSNFHLLKTSSDDGEQLYEKYKEVDGFTMPHKMTSSQAGQRIMTVITSIEINPELADSLFVAPPDSLRAPQEIVDQLKAQQEAAKKAAEEQAKQAEEETQETEEKAKQIEEETQKTEEGTE